jgi:6-phosphogluconolactonase
VGTANITPSYGLAPSGFAFDAVGYLDVAEARREATSSYQVNSDGSINVVSGSVPDGGREPLHIVETQNLSPQVAYVANSISDKIASYTVGSDGTLTLLDSHAASLPRNSKAIDMAMDASGAYLYILTQANGSITGYTINPDASLTKITVVNGLPHKGTWGLAAN